MKKKTVNLLNSLKVIVETSYPNLPKKLQKQIFEDFMYDSMVARLGQWVEGDFIDKGMASVIANDSKGKEMVKDKFKKNPSARDEIMKGAWGPKRRMVNSARNQLGREIDGEYEEPSVDKQAAGKFAKDTTILLTVMAMTGWGVKKATEFLYKYGKKGFEMLKKKFNPSMKQKALDRIDDLKKAVALAEVSLFSKEKKKNDILANLAADSKETHFGPNKDGEFEYPLGSKDSTDSERQLDGEFDEFDPKNKRLLGKKIKPIKMSENTKKSRKLKKKSK